MMDGEPAAMGEGHGAVRAAMTGREGPGAIVNGTVVMAAQQKTIAEIGGAALLPRKNVLGVRPGRRASREATPAVAGPQGRALAWREEALSTTHIENDPRPVSYTHLTLPTTPYV